MYGEDLAYIQAKGFGNLATGAAPEIIRRLRRAAIPIRRVVDAGCGAGPLTKILTEADFEVTGIDASPELVKYASAIAPKARLICGSLYDVEFPPCEAILAIGEPLTYHDPGVDASARISHFFERTARILPSGGLLIFDLIETGDTPLANRGWLSGEDWAVLFAAEEDRRDNSLLRLIETYRRIGECYRRGYEAHRARVFSVLRLREVLRQWYHVDTTCSYGAQELGPRRVAFFATRM